MLDFNKLLFQGYKCFKEETLIENIKSINIIIGKNNIGKSSLLDIIELINNPNLLLTQKNLKVVLNKKLSEADILKICHRGNYGGVFRNNYGHGKDNYTIGSGFVDERIGFELKANVDTNYSQERKTIFKTSYSKNQFFLNTKLDNEENFSVNVAEKLQYNVKTVKRIYAERNIFPELDTMDMVTDGYGNRNNKYY